MSSIDGEHRWPLLAGEKLIWEGRPGKGLLFAGRDALLVPFSLMWGGFAVFWETMAFRSPGPVFFRLWGIPFVLVGAYIIAGRFIVDAWLRGKTRYAVTSERILIARDLPFRKFIAANLAVMPQAQLTERADGRGTIRFGDPAPFWGRSAIWTQALDATPQFIEIDDARAVFDKIQRATRMAAAH
jgi:hypothetical protein